MYSKMPTEFFFQSLDGQLVCLSGTGTQVILHAHLIMEDKYKSVLNFVMSQT